MSTLDTLPTHPAHDEARRRCGPAARRAMRRWRELPGRWQTLAVEPLRFQVDCEYEALASRTIGHDEEDAPCFCVYEFVDTDLRAEDELIRAAVVYAETLVAWRLRDGRWLSRRTIVAEGQRSEEAHTRFSLGESMPR